MEIRLETKAAAHSKWFPPETHADLLPGGALEGE